MVMPARRSRGIDRAVFVMFVWSGTCVTCAPWKGANVLCTILCRLARTHQQACVARVQFVTLHDISNVMFGSLVCNLFSAIVPFGAQDQLRRSRDKG